MGTKETAATKTQTDRGTADVGFRHWAGAIALVGAAAAGYAVLEATQHRARRHQIAVDGPELTILHISDLHLTPRNRGRIRFVRSLAAFDPDLVVATGDILGGTGSLPCAMEALEPLLDRPGVFVYGSNDYHGPAFRNPLSYFTGPSSGRRAPTEELPAEELSAALQSHGWLDLNNARGTLAVAGSTVSFVGVNDAHLGWDQMPDDDGVRGDLHLGVAHAPYCRVLNAFAAEGCHMSFFGHTHGGQVCVPLYGALVTNCDLPRWRASGIQGWPGARPDGESVRPRRLFTPVPPGLEPSNMWVSISAGLGTSPTSPYRFACPPEASVVHLAGPGISGQ